MIRNPVVAGQFYPDAPSVLEAQIESFIDRAVAQEEVVGMVSPHAGYMYSGAVAGAAMSRVKLKDTFVIMGPNHTGLGERFSIMTDGVWRTPLGDVEIDSGLGNAILQAVPQLKEDYVAHLQEHSIEVQLPFLQYLRRDVRIVPIVLASSKGEIYKDIGKGIARAVRESGRDVVIMASSDMTHYEPQYTANMKDKQAIEAILALDGDGLLKRVEDLRISMCGYAPAVSMIIACRELGASRAELVKYQTSGDVSGDYSSVVGYAGIIVLGEAETRREGETGGEVMHPLIHLAKQSVESYIREGKVIALPQEMTPEMRERAGVFVSLKKGGSLRGCIGTFEPTRLNVAEEIIANAISSATHDPRFFPVTPDELPNLEYSVDVLSQPEIIESEAELDPSRYGVIVECGWRRGLLLPALEGVNTVEQQLEITRAKAGIAPGEPVKMYRFEVKRYR